MYTDPGLFTVSIAGVVLAYNLTEVEPVYRGFFCDDQTLQYPYKPDSVKDSMVVIISVLIPAGIVSIIVAGIIHIVSVLYVHLFVCPSFSLFGHPYSFLLIL